MYLFLYSLIVFSLFIIPRAHSMFLDWALRHGYEDMAQRLFTRRIATFSYRMLLNYVQNKDFAALNTLLTLEPIQQELPIHLIRLLNEATLITENDAVVNLLMDKFIPTANTPIHLMNGIIIHCIENNYQNAAAKLILSVPYKTFRYLDNTPGMVVTENRNVILQRILEDTDVVDNMSSDTIQHLIRLMLVHGTPTTAAQLFAVPKIKFFFRWQIDVLKSDGLFDQLEKILIIPGMVADLPDEYIFQLLDGVKDTGNNNILALLLQDTRAVNIILDDFAGYANGASTEIHMLLNTLSAYSEAIKSATISDYSIQTYQDFIENHNNKLLAEIISDTNLAESKRIIQATNLSVSHAANAWCELSLPFRIHYYQIIAHNLQLHILISNAMPKNRTYEDLNVARYIYIIYLACVAENLEFAKIGLAGLSKLNNPEITDKTIRIDDIHAVSVDAIKNINMEAICTENSTTLHNAALKLNMMYRNEQRRELRRGVQLL